MTYMPKEYENIKKIINPSGEIRYRVKTTYTVEDFKTYDEAKNFIKALNKIIEAL